MKQKSKNKRPYEHPTMSVIELRRQNYLLSASNNMVGLEDYNLPEYSEE